MAFVGGGAMATALAGGFIKTGKVANAAQISIGEPFVAQHDKLKQTLGDGVRVSADNAEAIKGADIVFLAVKPQVLEGVLKSLAPSILPSQVVVSIAAGVTIEKIESFVASSPVIRVMPNTPAFVGEMASGYALGSKATADHRDLVHPFLESLGVAFEVKESLLDAVCGLSGSGPAYVFIMIEAMADGGVRSGLPRNIALKLAAQTVFGSAKMVLELGKHPGELKDMVTSPGGTTIAAVHALEKAMFRAGVIDAVYAATNRSKELGKGE